MAFTLGHSPNGGKIVDVLRLAEAEGKLPDGYPYFCDVSRPIWIVCFAHEIRAPIFKARRFSGYRLTKFSPVEDSRLRPIRDTDGQDEMVKKVGLPPPVYITAPEWVNNPIDERETIPCWWVSP